MGNALVARMYYSLKKLGVPVLFETKLDKLVYDGAAVQGVQVSGKNGTQRILARRGVVLATGGFAHAEDYRDRFMPNAKPIYSIAAPDRKDTRLNYSH